MVALQPPPPNRPVTPIFWDIPADEKLVRLYDPTRRGATALTFRSHGPLKRFDHQRGRGPNRDPHDDPDRAIYYAAWWPDISRALSSCFVECFGDTGIVEFANIEVALPTVVREIHLLDLRDNGAMCAGTVVAIAKCDHRLSQSWSRYFYDKPDIFSMIDGLMYLNAHNDEPAIALYERAQSALSCSPGAVTRIDHPGLRPVLIEIMKRNNLVFGKDPSAP